MSSRIELVVRSAVRFFSSLKSELYNPNNSFLQNDHFQQLCKLAESVTAADVGLCHLPQFPVDSAVPAIYMEIFEHESVSIGVFVLRENAKIPLHDHPGMHGIIRVLHGDLAVQSYTQVKEKREKRAWLFGKKLLTAIKNTSQVISNEDGVQCLSPLDSNIHEIQALNRSAAFLDILAPPYDVEGSSGIKRDCQYYKPIEMSENSIYFLKEINSPASFWCESIPYRGPKITINDEN